MRKFIVIARNRWVPPGTWLLCDDIGETLRPHRLISGPRGMHFEPMVMQPIPWYGIAPFVIEPGFHISIEDLEKIAKLRKKLATAEEDLKAIADFQSSNAEIIEPELERRGKEQNPTLGGVVVPLNVKSETNNDPSAGTS